MSPKNGENLSPNKLKILVSQLIFQKKITKIGENLFIENDPPKIGEKSFTKKVKILVNQHKFL